MPKNIIIIVTIVTSVAAIITVFCFITGIFSLPQILQKPSQNTSTSNEIMTTATPSASSSVPSTSTCEPLYKHLNKGETAEVGECDFAVGDVAANGLELFDSDSQTGLIVDFVNPARVLAPFGADIITVPNLCEKIPLIEIKKEEMLKNTSISRVDIIKYYGGQAQQIQGK